MDKCSEATRLVIQGSISWRSPDKLSRSAGGASRVDSRLLMRYTCSAGHSSTMLASFAAILFRRSDKDLRLRLRGEAADAVSTPPQAQCGTRTGSYVHQSMAHGSISGTWGFVASLKLAHLEAGRNPQLRSCDREFRSLSDVQPPTSERLDGVKYTMKSALTGLDFVCEEILGAQMGIDA